MNDQFAGFSAEGGFGEEMGDGAQPAWMTQEQFESSQEQHDGDLMADDDDGADYAADDFGDDDPTSVPQEAQADSRVYQLAKTASQHPRIHCI